MAFLKLNITQIFLIIVLSLKGFYSPVNYPEDVPSSSNPIPETLQLLPPPSPHDDNTDSEFLLASGNPQSSNSAIAACKLEINSIFPDGKDLRDYIIYAIDNLVLESGIEYHAKLYYYTFFTYFKQGNAPTIEKFCEREPENMRRPCVETIDAYFHHPGGLLYNLLYHSTADEVKKQPDIVKLYVEVFKTNFAVVPRQRYLEPFRTPEDYCIWLIEKKKQEEANKLNLNLRLGGYNPGSY